MSHSIRPASRADIDGLRSLWAMVDDLHREALPNLFHQPNNWPNRAMVEALIDGPDSAILVAEVEGALAGFVTLLLKRSAETPIRLSRTYVEIDNMAVDPALRRQGIGRDLMQAAADWASQKDIRSLDLNVYGFNEAAFRLYEASGFTTLLRKMSRDL